MSSYKLTYFDIRGRAELARLMFTYAGIDFEDVRVSSSDWPALKPKTPFGQLPILEIDGKHFTESVAICNYLAREFGLYGKDSLDMLAVDEVIGKVQDVWTQIVEWIHAKGDQDKAAVQKTNEETHFPKYLEALEKILNKSDTAFFVGDQLTYADLAVFDALDLEFPDSLIDKYPKVKANRDMVKNNEKLKDYIATRKSAPF